MKYVVELVPVTKKNSPQICVNPATGRPFVAQSKQYKAYEEAALVYLNPQGEPIAEPVNVKMVFYMPTHRRVDLSNLQAACLDVLVKARVLEDDNSNIVVSMDGSRVEYDKARPRTEIEIQKAR